jgi:menaquinone-9 beta-reductase
LSSTGWDVVVVGGGPAGTSTAALLANLGFRVILLDRCHFPRTKPCAEYMSPGVGQVLERLKLAQALEGLSPRFVPGMDIISASGNRLRLRYCLDGESYSAFTMTRRSLDHGLLALVQKRGVQVEEGFIARRPIIESGLVRGVTGSVGTRSISIRARLTIVADGSRSTLAQSLNLAMPPLWPVRMGLVAHFDGRPRLDCGYGQMHVSRYGYCGVAPLPDGQVNVAMVFPASILRNSRERASSFFEDWINRHPLLRSTLEECTRISSVRGLSPIGSRVRREWGPGFLLVGDAAGFFDPFTGEGIYRALAGAELAAQTAAAALVRGDVSSSALKPYGDLRKNAFRWKSRLTELVQLFVQRPVLMDYALPRLASRADPAQKLANALGDLIAARQFLNPSTLASALSP